MPRFDKYPQKRGLGNALYNPLRSGIQGWTDPLGAIDEAAQRAGGGIRQRIEDGLDSVLDGVVDAVLDATGIDISGPVALLEQLLDIPLGFLDGTTLGSATDVLGQFFPFLPGATSGDFDPIAAAAAFITARLSPTGLLANWQDLYQKITGEVDGALDELGDLFQQGLFGQIAAGRLGQISAAAIDNLNPETLDNPGFDTDASIRDNEEVDWDGTFGRTRPGSMKIIADGSTHTAVSNPLRVVPGREVNVEIWTYYEDVTANPGTTPIRLSVAAYTDPATVGDPPLWVADTLIPAPSIASPAGDSSSVSGNVAGWVKIVGSYVVPAGVDIVVNKVQVTEDCLAGAVHFDDASRKRGGLLPKEYVEGLLADLTEHANRIQATINKGWEALTGLPAAVDKSVDDLKSALQNIPQGNIQDFAAALAGAGQDIRDAIVQALGGTGTGHTAADVIAALMNIPQHAIDNLEDDLADAGDAIADVFDDVRDGWNSFWNGIFRTTGSTGKTAADVEAAAKQVADNADSAQALADTAQSATNTISKILAIPHIVPSWQGGLADDVSFPIAQIDGTLASALNKLYLIPVTTQQDRAYTALKFGLTGTSMTNFYVGIYYMNPLTGSIAKVLDCGDVKSSLTSSYNQQAITLPTALLATRGDTYFVGLLQIGGTAGSLHRWSNTTNFSTGLYPQFVGGEASGTFSSLPSSVSAANVIAGTRVWAALGDVTPILAPGSAFYADGFNRANAAQLSTPWTSRWLSGAGDIGVYSNMFGPQSASGPPGTNVYTYNSKMSTTNHEVQADCMNIPGNGSVAAAILLRGNATGCVYVRVSDGGAGWTGASIRTHTSYNLGSTLAAGTSRASALLVSGSFTGTLRCSAVGNTYTLYSGASQIAQWVDSGGVFAYDGTSREVGVAGYASGGSKGILDNWQAKDI